MFNRKGEFFLLFEKPRKAFLNIKTTREEILTSIMNIMNNLIVTNQFELLHNLKLSIDKAFDEDYGLYFIDKTTKRQILLKFMDIINYVDKQLAIRTIELFGKKSHEEFEKYLFAIIYLKENYDEDYDNTIVTEMIFNNGVTDNLSGPKVIKIILLQSHSMIVDHIIIRILDYDTYINIPNIREGTQIQNIANILYVLLKYGKIFDPHFISEYTILDILCWPEPIVKVMFDSMTDNGKFPDYPIVSVSYNKYADFYDVVVKRIESPEPYNDGIEYVFRWIKKYYPKYIFILIERIVKSNNINNKKKQPYLSYLRKLNILIKYIKANKRFNNS